MDNFYKPSSESPQQTNRDSQCPPSHRTLNGPFTLTQSKKGSAEVVLATTEEVQHVPGAADHLLQCNNPVCPDHPGLVWIGNYT